MKSKRLSATLSWLSVAIVAIVTTNCTFRTPAKEVPVPNEQKQTKAFFLKNVGTSGSDSLPDTLTPKTFLCGWASESEQSLYRPDTLHNYNQAWGCNIQFEITEKTLIGRLINPNYPNDRTQWQQVLEIPIKEHYYSEADKDTYGRDTNTFVDNKDRSHWSRRPNMTLDLGGIRVNKWAFALLGEAGPAVSSVDSVEWDMQNGYLAFSVHTRSHYISSGEEAVYRFNFKSFETDTSFKPTYVAASNTRFMNPVFTIGQKAEDQTSVYYLAKWELGETQEIELINFPNSEMEDAAHEMLNDYNVELTKIVKPGYVGVYPFFKGVPVKKKHTFDLRKPSITWVADRRVAGYSPLGVAYVNPDLRNGKVLWGGLTLWGGMLENYLKNYSPSGLISSTGTSSRIAVVPGDSAFPGAFAGVQKLPGQMMPDFSQYGSWTLNPEKLLTSVLPDFLSNTLAKLGLNLSPSTIASKSQGDLDEMLNTANSQQTLTPADIEQLRQGIAGMKGEQADYQAALNNQLSTALSRLTTDSRNIPDGVAKAFSQFNFPIDESIEAQASAKELFGDDNAELTYDQKVARMKGSIEQYGAQNYNGMVQDENRTFADVAENWREGLLEQITKDPNFDYDHAMKMVVKGLLAHEFGHVLGLGHNFRGNVLPPESRVPAKEYARLKAKTKGHAVSTASVSIMDYNHGQTEVSFGDDDAKLQTQDIQVLNYIYANKYPSGIKGDDYVYSDVEDGVVPDENLFLDQCNDLRASIGDDPYCARWDSGYDARTIVDGRFDNLTNNLVHNLFALNQARGADSYSAYYYFWNRAFMETSRIRIFYDEMRKRLAEERPEFMADLLLDNDALLKFSDACSMPDNNGVTYPAILTKFFSDPKNAEFKELCQINRTIIERYAQIMALDGLDYTDISYSLKDQYILWSRSDAANGSFGHALGTWRQLSIFPLKYMTLLSLTTPTPLTTWGRWILPVPKYADDKTRFLMNTLYPNEFTSAMAEVTRKNIKVSTEMGNTVTHIGLPVLAMGSLMNRMAMSNDPLRVNPSYTDLLRKQSQFNFNPGQDVVAILMEARTRENSDAQRVTHFDTKLYDFRAGDFADRNMKNAYLLRDGKIVVEPPPNTFLLPVTDFYWASSTRGIVIALRIKMSDNITDDLFGKSLRAELTDRNTKILESCIVGDKDKQNGLQDFFIGRTDNKSIFPGFAVNTKVASDSGHLRLFYDSLIEMFDRYYAYYEQQGTPVDRNRCQETQKGVSLTATTALVINGWWLPQTLDNYLKSGN